MVFVYDVHFNFNLGINSKSKMTRIHSTSSYKDLILEQFGPIVQFG